MRVKKSRATQKRRNHSPHVDKRELFCLEYVKDFNATQAAIRAGYSKATAGPASSRLLNYVTVQNRVAELQEKLRDEHHDDIKFLVDELRKIAEVDVSLTTPTLKGVVRNKLEAIEKMAKHFGLYEKDNAQRSRAVTINVEGEG